MPSRAPSAVVFWLILARTGNAWLVGADCGDQEPAASSCFGSWSRSIPAVLRIKKRGTWLVPVGNKTLKKGV